MVTQQILVLFFLVRVQVAQQIAQMAESVDALVSNTSGVTSIPVRPRVWVQEKEPNICKSNIWLFSSLRSVPKMFPNIPNQGRKYS